MDAPRAIDVYAGAGGLSLGLQRAGFAVVGVEMDPDAAATHAAQVGPCHLADATTWHPEGPATLVSGGPPCTTFSHAGDRAGFLDARGLLFRHLLRIAKEADAEAVLMENVRGLMDWRDENGTALEQILAAFRADGWTRW